MFYIFARMEILILKNFLIGWGIKVNIYDDGDIRAHISTDLYSYPLRYCATLLGGEMSNVHAYGKTPEESVKKLKNTRNFLRVWKGKLKP